MAIAKVIKQPSDLVINTTILSPNLGPDTAPIALLRPGAAESVALAHDVEEMVDLGFDENTPEYALVEAMFDVEDFEGPVQIGTYSSTPVISLDDVTVTPTEDGATIGATVPGIQKFMEDHLFDGPKWYIPVGMSDEDIKGAAEVLYTNKHGELVNQVTSIDELQKWHDYAVATQNVKNKLGHFRTVVEKNPENQVAAQACAYASMHIALDWMRVGNMTQFTPGDWVQSELDMIDKLNGLTVVNKANDYLLSGNKELNGDFIDNSFNAQYNTEFIQYRLQKWLNKDGYTEINDDNINELYTTALTAGDDLFKLSTVATGSDGKADFHVKAKSYSQLSLYEIAQRKYKSLTIKQKLPNSMETVYVNNVVQL